MRERRIAAQMEEEGGGKSRLENQSFRNVLLRGGGPKAEHILKFWDGTIRYYPATWQQLWCALCQTHLNRLAEGSKSILASWKAGTAIKQVTIEFEYLFILINIYLLIKITEFEYLLLILISSWKMLRQLFHEYLLLSHSKSQWNFFLLQLIYLFTLTNVEKFSISNKNRLMIIY